MAPKSPLQAGSFLGDAKQFLAAFRKERSLMAKVRAYHTTLPERPPERDVYHDHDNCPDGKRIRPEHKAPGDAGRPRCKECVKLG